jgi:hypothetical protein
MTEHFQHEIDIAHLFRAKPQDQDKAGKAGGRQPGGNHGFAKALTVRCPAATSAGKCWPRPVSKTAVSCLVFRAFVMRHTTGEVENMSALLAGQIPGVLWQ